MGSELSALGININYAPCVDVNINPQNPVVGTRSFGEDPDLVRRLGAALVEGIQSRGVAATAKHFPGHGDTASDSHYGLTTLPHSLERLRRVELPPFQAAMKAGVKLVMTAHLGIPAIDGPSPPPATLLPNILTGLLRGDLGFEGVVLTDAMNMQAIRQGELLGEDVVRAAKAGVDLLLICDDPQDHARAHAALVQAAQTGQLTLDGMETSLSRISHLKEWLSKRPQRPDLSIIRCTEHMQVADEIAERSITQVRDRDNLLPIRLDPEKRLVVVVPKTKDLTPADTSSTVMPRLADAIRTYHPGVDEIQIPFAPDERERAVILQKLRGYAFVIIGTINAYTQEGQAELVRANLRMGMPVVVVALRLPYDLMAFPEAPAFLCTYSILEPSMRAAARALFGLTKMTGHLPVSVPGM